MAATTQVRLLVGTLRVCWGGFAVVVSFSLRTGLASRSFAQSCQRGQKSPGGFGDAGDDGQPPDYVDNKNSLAPEGKLAKQKS